MRTPLPPYPWSQESPITLSDRDPLVVAHSWIHPVAHLRVLRSISVMDNNDTWIHVSVSRPDRLPTWQELSKVKREFFGAHVSVVQVLPAESDYVNLHVYCLHLWSPYIGEVRRMPNLQDIVLERGA